MPQKSLLMIPGPTPVPEEVLRAQYLYMPEGNSLKYMSLGNTSLAADYVLDDYDTRATAADFAELRRASGLSRGSANTRRQSRLARHSRPFDQAGEASLQQRRLRSVQSSVVAAGRNIASGQTFPRGYSRLA